MTEDIHSQASSHFGSDFNEQKIYFANNDTHSCIVFDGILLHGTTRSVPSHLTIVRLS